jgi:hypothetical protein
VDVVILSLLSRIHVSRHRGDAWQWKRGWWGATGMRLTGGGTSLTGVEELNRWGRDRRNVRGGPDRQCTEEEDLTDARPDSPSARCRPSRSSNPATGRPTKNATTAPLATSWEQ